MMWTSASSVEGLKLLVRMLKTSCWSS